MFHKHYFIHAVTAEKLFCRCGLIKDIHRHIWEFYKEAEKQNTLINCIIERIFILRCTKCGDLKNHVIN